jgi:hypothetical protein
MQLLRGCRRHLKMIVSWRLEAVLRVISSSSYGSKGTRMLGSVVWLCTQNLQRAIDSDKTCGTLLLYLELYRQHVLYFYLLPNDGSYHICTLPDQRPRRIPILIRPNLPTSARKLHHPARKLLPYRATQILQCLDFHRSCWDMLAVQDRMNYYPQAVTEGEDGAANGQRDD